MPKAKGHHGHLRLLDRFFLRRLLGVLEQPNHLLLLIRFAEVWTQVEQPLCDQVVPLDDVFVPKLCIVSATRDGGRHPGGG